MFRYKGEALILFATMAWGVSYLFTKTALQTVDGFNLVAFRFTIAFAVTALVFHRRTFRSGRNELLHGGVLGALLFVSASFLAKGIKATSIANAGFIVGSMVLCVAVLDAVASRKKPGAGLIAGVLLTVAGIGVLTLRGSLSVNPGDLYCLAAMLALAFHVMAAQRAARRAEPVGASVAQFGVAGLLAWAASALADGRTVAFPEGGLLLDVAVLGVVGTAAAFVCQVTGQKYISPTRTAFLFTMEPVFATLFAWLFMGEPVTWHVYVGGGLLLTGVYVSEYRSRTALESVALSNAPR